MDKTRSFRAAYFFVWEDARADRQGANVLG
jgi:hypothetical protein